MLRGYVGYTAGPHRSARFAASIQLPSDSEREPRVRRSMSSRFNATETQAKTWALFYSGFKLKS
jgi:hypothetical protein